MDEESNESSTSKAMSAKTDSIQNAEPTDKELQKAVSVFQALLGISLEEDNRLEIIQEHFRSHRGPLPSPDDLKAYDQVMPGLAERIVSQAAKEQDFRHNTNQNLIDREFKLRGRGQILAISALAMMLSIVGMMVWFGFATEGALLGGSIIVGVVTVFVTGKNSDNKPMEPQATSDDDE